jgi:hypothetical protein
MFAFSTIIKQDLTGKIHVKIVGKSNMWVGARWASSLRGHRKSRPPAGRSGELEAWRDDFLVELLALVQKYRPEAKRRLGRL